MKNRSRSVLLLLSVPVLVLALNSVAMAAGVPAVDNDGGADTSLGAGVAGLRGTLTDDGGSTVTGYVYWGEANGGTDLSAWGHVITNAPLAVGSFTNVVTNLYYGVTYYYRCYATNASGSNWAPATTNFLTSAPLASSRPSVGSSSFAKAQYYAFTPAANNLLAGLSPSVNSNPSAGQGGTGPVTLLTDGAIVADNAHTYSIGNNAILTYTLGSAPNGYDITNINIYSGWNDSGRENITLASIAYSTVANPTVFNAIPGSSVDYEGGTAVAVARLFASGGAIATGAYAVQFNFGNQENSWVGYRELEVVGSAWIAHSSLTLSNNSASQIARTSATLNGTLTGSGAVCNVWAYWGPTDGGTNSANWTNSAYVGSFTNVVSTNLNCAVSGLTPETPYCFRFFGTNAATNFWAAPSLSFKTQPDFSTWLHMMKVTFSGYNPPGGASTLACFPTLVVLSNGMVNGFSFTNFAAGATYDELRFTDSSGHTQLNYEVEQWNTNTAAYVWVQVPALASSNDFIYAYYGKSGVTAPPYATNGAVWSGGYAAVWHFAYVPAGTVSTRDSTSVGKNGVPSLMNAANSFIGYGVSMPSYISLPANSSLDLSTGMTFSAWAKTSSAANQGILFKGQPNLGDLPYGNLYRMEIESSGIVDGIAVHALGAGGFQMIQGHTAVNDGNWHYLTVTFDSSANSLNLYVDGITNAVPVTTSGNLMTSTYDVSLGSDRPSADDFFSGSLDEVRYQTAGRSANWIWAEYMNMASNRVFNTYEMVPPNKPKGTIFFLH